jgi:hypothetical protein
LGVARGIGERVLHTSPVSAKRLECDFIVPGRVPKPSKLADDVGHNATLEPIE